MMSRFVYWGRVGVVLVILGITTALVTVVESTLGVDLRMAYAIVATLFSLFYYVRWSIRRFHDVGLSGKWLCLHLIPVIGSLIVVVVSCLPTNCMAKYGSVHRRVRSAK